jgi:hypothetical protein
MAGDLAVLVAFIEARLAEDERKAEGLLFAARIPEKKPDFFACGGPAAEAYWEHFEPKRMLGDVEAKRAIVEEYRKARKLMMDNRETWDLVRSAVGALRVTVTHLAAAWSDHPDYRQEWR